MSNRLPTVLVKGQDGQALIINAKDFDKEKHELYQEQKPKKKRKKRIKKEDK